VKLDERSIKNLMGIHKDLCSVVERAIEITQVDFTVIEGLRTAERQKILYDSGASITMNSRHLTGHAVDLAARIGGEIRWDWPLYHRIAAAMKTAAKELKIDLEWGGDWRYFKDGPHFQLSKKTYP